MLTVRWFDKGADRVMEATSIQVQVRSHEDGADYGGRSVFVDRPDNGILCIDTGTVFIMNERGKTIATYNDCEGASPKAA